MKNNFYQGKSDLLDGKKEDKRIEFIKLRIAEFFNMKNIHFLFGSGTSCDAVPNMGGLYKYAEEEIGKCKIEEIKEEFKKIITKTGKNNLEGILGVLYSNRIYLEGIDTTTEDSRLSVCKQLIEIIEKVIFNKLNFNFKGEDENVVLSTYKKFYQKIALRNKDLSRINIFTTNNDLFNEMALDSLNIHYINGFSGGINKYFNPALFNYTFSKRMDTSIEKFEPVENMVYLYKLHGSVNWVEDNSKSNNFFNIKEEYPPLKFDKEKNILIYPTPTKQDKSLGSPYVDLFREFQKKLLEPHSVLFVIGYSFSDDHINNIIYRSLATNSTINLVIINYIEKDKLVCNIDDNRIFRIWSEEDKPIEKETDTTKEDKHIEEEIDTAKEDKPTEEEADTTKEDKPTEEETDTTKEDKPIEEEDKIPLHYFSKIVGDLLPNIDSYKQQDEVLSKFVKLYTEEKNKEKNDDREDNIS